MEKFKADFEKAAIMQESYQKRLNILVYGIEKDQECARETRQKTAKKFDHFLYDALKMDTDDVEIEEIYQLPQRPVIKDEKKVIRPIIVKLANATTKHNTFETLKRLRTYKEQKSLKVNHCYSPQTIYQKSFWNKKNC